MTWVKLDDSLPEDPRWDIAGAAGLGLHVAALAYCNRNLTDGLVSLSRARRLIECGNSDDVIERLVAAGFWERDGDDVRLVDFLDDQPSAEKVREVRAAKAARQARWVEKQRASRDASADGSADGRRDVPPSRPTPPRKERGGGGKGANAPARRSSRTAKRPTIAFEDGPR